MEALKQPGGHFQGPDLGILGRTFPTCMQSNKMGIGVANEGNCFFYRSAVSELSGPEVQNLNLWGLGKRGQ